MHGCSSWVVLYVLNESAAAAIAFARNAIRARKTNHAVCRWGILASTRWNFERSCGHCGYVIFRWFVLTNTRLWCAEFNLSAEGIKLQTLDNAQVFLLDVSLNASAFTSFHL
jgi:hypothetical protein